MNLPYMVCAGNVIGDRRMGRCTCLRDTTIRKPFQGSGRSGRLLPNFKYQDKTFVPTVHNESFKSHSARTESLPPKSKSSTDTGFAWVKGRKPTRIEKNSSRGLIYHEVGVSDNVEANMRCEKIKA